jgi:2,3-bisphosphoglycerate-independent phosphoglycerate mutase
VRARYSVGRVKYAIIIADGAADLPLEELGGRTPLDAAATPNLDELARIGRVGAAATTPPGFGAGSDVCSMSLLGYDPAKYHTGRAPLEAAALGVPLGERDWIFRLNLVTVGGASGPDAGLMLDHSAGAISDAEARELVGAIVEQWRQDAPEVAREFDLYAGVSYRNILVDRSGTSYADLKTTPPHEIPRKPWGEFVPAGLHAGRLGALMESASRALVVHPVNTARIKAGKRPANAAWIWGQGTKPAMPSFESRFGLRGAMITAVDLLAGIAALMGWDRLDVPGVTSYHDTDYAAQGRATCDALDQYDIVCCHVESPDEASHQGDSATKVAAIEAIDRFVVGPVVEKLRTFGDAASDSQAEGWRVLVMPDHYTLVSTRKHDATPPPLVMAGSWVRSAVERRFIELDAEESDLQIDPGHDLMEFFLHGGRGRVKKKTV